MTPCWEEGGCCFPPGTAPSGGRDAQGPPSGSLLCQKGRGRHSTIVRKPSVGVRHAGTPLQPCHFLLCDLGQALALLWASVSFSVKRTGWMCCSQNPPGLMLQDRLLGSWLPRGLYSTTPGGLPLGQHKAFLRVRALGVGWGGTRTSCAKQRSIGAPLPLGRVSTRPQAASVARETGSAWKLRPKPGVSGLEAGPGESVRAECCGLHAGGREGLRWGPRKAPPKVQGEETGAEGWRGKRGLTFSPGWPFTPWGSHMQHRV